MGDGGQRKRFLPRSESTFGKRSDFCTRKEIPEATQDGQPHAQQVVRSSGSLRLISRADLAVWGNCECEERSEGEYRATACSTKETVAVRALARLSKRHTHESA